MRQLRQLGIPAVEVVGVVVNRPGDLDAILVTRFLDHSISYRALFANPRGGQPTDRLLDAMVELLARLHLAGFMWGDCSLSNTLFRLDAGALAAHLVDAETSELHPALTDGQRLYDVDLARERVGGELFDLQAGGLLPGDIDPVDVADEIPGRYDALWSELTREDTVLPTEQRYRIAERLRRLNDLGFDVDEVELVESGEGNKLRIRTRVAESGTSPAAPVHAHGPGCPGEPGAAAAQRPCELPVLSGAGGRRSGARGGGRQRVAHRVL